jgi:hypothetical protein
MVKRERVVMMAGGGLVLAALLYVWLHGKPASTTIAAGPRVAAGAGAGAGGSDLPRIGLDRLTQMPPPVRVGIRDIFDFGPPPTPPPTPIPAATPTPVVAAASPTPVPTPAGPPPPPPVNVKYIGSVEAEKGPKVAFFLTEQKEVLTGQVGDTVMNRFKVVRIGIESVDVQDLGSGQLRRIPLRGN